MSESESKDPTLPSSKPSLDPALISFRGFESGDLQFVLKTWINGIYYGNEDLKSLDRMWFLEHYKPFLIQCLKNPTLRIKIACLTEDPDTILGYSVWQEPCFFHFIYVKKEWRRLGIATYLMPHKSFWFYTHQTKELAKFDEKHIPKEKWVYSPHMFFFLTHYGEAPCQTK